jgi:hypothetical protein
VPVSRPHLLVVLEAALKQAALALLMVVLAGAAAFVLVEALRGPSEPQRSPQGTAPAAVALSWRPPAQNSAKEIHVTSGKSSVGPLDPDTDYRIVMPRSRPLTSELKIDGGRNVRLIGGEIRTGGRAVYLKDQTRSAYVEGLKITGPRTKEGFNLDQRKGATVFIQNVYVQRTHGSERSNHADLIQTWAGPRRLLVDRFRGASSYQGFFLLPRQQWHGAPRPAGFDLRRVQIDVSRGGYALWRDTGFPMRVRDVFVEPNPAKGSRDQFLWPKPGTGDGSWRGVREGHPAKPFVDPRKVGLGYKSAWRG